MTSYKSTQIVGREVKPTTEILENVLIRTHYTEKFESKVISALSIDYPEEARPNPTTIIKTGGVTHGFVAAIHEAYNLHQHLRISPDDVWLTIAQGVSQHINLNAEKFRSYFVNHEGEKDIIVFAADVLRSTENRLEGDWPVVVNRLTQKVGENVTKIELTELLECNFSTSTSVSTTASKVILLDALKKYFKYHVWTRCGIPKVTLEGTLEDWENLQKKVVKLRELSLDMDFWLDRLEPVVWQLVATYRGDIDEKFWSKVLMSRGGGTGVPVSWDGWIAGFFPYEKSGDKILKNSIVTKEIPDGMVNVPFDTDIDKKLQFSAGFLGAHQTTIGEGADTEVFISPVIGWLVVDQ
ncbi:hypothetical protein G9A89_011522 [Geosiphon pyriformis]|nr:hypothetical protein G9A89_011522 [Geosiphon pyriformis]